MRAHVLERCKGRKKKMERNEEGAGRGTQGERAGDHSYLKIRLHEVQQTTLAEHRLPSIHFTT